LNLQGGYSATILLAVKMCTNSHLHLFYISMSLFPEHLWNIYSSYDLFGF
jgi:hypothetical protein